ncbi:TlpA disulfide reductase family protein [Algibacter aquimarinus]|uniref:Thioredoxin domain-containing protein n=1 Tax=Algibacter aquimarinus TaxID=1136748 RepID=A0ABP9H228_9FLAO
MVFKRNLILFLLVPIFSFGQIHLSEIIQDSKIVDDTKSKLFFIDFWATWCGPCITVSKYLNSLQAQYPNDFYIISLSQESPDVVKRFMTKHQTGLAVSMDYEGETFAKYGVVSLPYGVLINAKGDKIWEGHPAELKGHHIKEFLIKNNEEAYLKNMFKYEAYKKVSRTSNREKLPKKDFQYSKLTNIYIDELKIEKRAGFLELKGTLKQILAYVNSVNTNQIELSSKLNEIYKMTFKYDYYAHNKMKRAIYKAFKLKESFNYIKGEVITFNIEKAKLWDNKQIDWGNDTPNFLVGDSDIKADNVSFNDIKYKLSSLLKTPIVIENDAEILDKNSSNDWYLHYKYFDLMVANFLDNYGIKVEKKSMVYPKYTIIKKTP